MPTPHELGIYRLDAAGNVIAHDGAPLAEGQFLRIPLMFSDTAAKIASEQPPAASGSRSVQDCLPWWSKPLATPTAGGNGAFADADLIREAAYAQRKREVGNFELQSGEVASIQGPATSLVELQARAAVAAAERDQRLSNAWRNEDQE